MACEEDYNAFFSFLTARRDGSRAKRKRKEGSEEREACYRKGEGKEEVKSDKEEQDNKRKGKNA